MRPAFLKKQSIMPPNYAINDPAPSNYAMKDLQQTINPDNHLPHRNLCKCTLCAQNGNLSNLNNDVNHLQSNTLSGKKLFKKFLEGLTTSGAKTLKIFIPDLFFVEGDTLEIYQTSRDSRVSKISGATPIKHMYPTMLRMRKQYKSQLEQLFNKKMYDKVDPQLMHAKYYDICVPSHFNPGVSSPFLQGNKHHFKRYVLHKDKRYQIQSLEQHKMNDRQPFCIVVYKDGNSQLFNQLQFQLFTFQSYNKIQQQVLYFQSYIKYKKEAESILYSEYIYSPETIDLYLDGKTETEIMITLGGLGKYDEGYNDLQTLQQLTIELMLSQPKKYVEMMTYKIVHYLAMASRIYINHIKIKWIINDIGTIYMQQIMQCKISEHPRRIIKFKLAKAEQNGNFYSDKSNNFLDMYKDLKRRRVLNTLIIKKDIDKRAYQDLLASMNPQMKQEYDLRQNQEQSRIDQLLRPSKSKKKKVQNRLYHTIDVASQQKKFILPKRLKVSDASTYEQHIKQHPQLVMRNMRYDSASLNRLSPQKTYKVDSKINNHFIIHMSTQDKKVINSLDRKNRDQKIRSSLDRYIQKRSEKVQKSLLFTTFHDLNRQNIEKMNDLFGHQKIAKKLLENSTK